MALEELEKELYAAKRDLKRAVKTSGKPKAAVPVPPPQKTIPESWEGETAPESKGVRFLSLVKPLFWIIIILSLSAASVGGYFVYQYFGSKGVSLAIEGDSEVKIGVPFEIKISLKNETRNVLQGSRLALQLPPFVKEVGKAGESAAVSSLGDIGEGGSASQSYQLIAESESEEGVKNIKAVLNYEVKTLGNGLKFEESRNFDLRLSGFGFFADLASPPEVLNGEEFEIEIDYRNDSRKIFSGLELKMDYPPNFSFRSASPAPSRGNNTWRLDDLFPDSSDKLIVKGALIGPVGARSDFSLSFASQFLGASYSLNKKSFSVSIAPSPFEIKVELNGRDDYVARIGDRLFYAIKYKNSSDSPLVDAVIRAKLIGELFNLASVKSVSLFDSVVNALIWNTATTPDLRLLNPGAEGSVSFEVGLRETFPILRLNDKNYSLKVEAEIESPTVPQGVKTSATSALTRLETKLAGAVKVDAKIYFRDAASGIVNSGPMPPQVNQKTQFTVHWLVTNYSTDISKVEVKTVLPPAVNWTGVVKNNIGTAPSYDDRAREVTWVIDKVPATKGLVGDPAEGIFQIETTPAINQIGQLLPLIGGTTLKAVDDFVGLEMTASDAAVDTSLPDDPTVGQGGKVME